MSKTKTSPGLSAFHMLRGFHWGDSGGYTDLTPYYGVPTAGTTISLGDSPPGWRTLAKRCTNASSHMSVSAVSLLSRSVGYYCQVYAGPNKHSVMLRMVDCFGNTTGDYVIPVMPDSSATVQSLTSQAYGRFVQNAVSVNQKVSGRVIFGELHKTIHMIRHPLSALVNLLHQYKHKVHKLKGPRATVLSAARDTYLEYTFGWAPFIQDLTGAMQALSEIINQRFGRDCQRVQGNAKGDASAYHSASGTYFWRRQLHCVRTVAVKYYGGVKTEASTAGYARLVGTQLSTAGYDIWELIPFSWAVDYFVNIGQMLQSIAVLDGGISWVTKTVIITDLVTCISSQGDLYDPTFEYVAWDPDDWVIRSVNIQRDALSPGSISVTPMRFTLPSIKQCINLAAVGWQVASSLGSLLRR